MHNGKCLRLIMVHALTKWGALDKPLEMFCIDEGSFKNAENGRRRQGGKDFRIQYEETAVSWAGEVGVGWLLRCNGRLDIHGEA